MHYILQEQGRRHTAAEWTKILAFLRRAKSIVPTLYSISSTLISNTSRQEWHPVGTSITAHLYCILKKQPRLAAPSKAPSRWKAQWRSFFRLIAQVLYMVFLCNFLLQCVLKVKNAVLSPWWYLSLNYQSIHVRGLGKKTVKRCKDGPLMPTMTLVHSL